MYLWLFLSVLVFRGQNFITFKFSLQSKAGAKIEPFYIDHKRLNLLTKTKLLQLKLLNFSLLLIDERGGDKLKLKHWPKSEYQAVLTWMIVICYREKLISNKTNCDLS